MLQTHFTFEPSPTAPATREEACAAMQRTVHAIAREACGRRGRVGFLHHDDLVTTGMIGVLQAFDSYDASHGLDFVRFARYRVRGAILDAVRSQDTISRRRRHLARAMRYEHDQLDPGHSTPAKAVAEKMGMDLESYWKATAATRSARVLSLDAPVGQDDEAPTLSEVVADDAQQAPSEALWRSEAADALHAALAKLPERTRDAVVRYYLDGSPQAEIADDHGITVSRVSQILTAARRTLRAHLADTLDQTDFA